MTNPCQGHAAESARVDYKKEAERLADAIVREVAELLDRDSPADWPAAMLVTSDELRGIVLAHIQRGVVPVYCTPTEHEGRIVYEHTDDPIPNADGFVLYAAAPAPAEVPMPDRPVGFIKPDTDTCVYFYEQDFYVLSNFSAFSLVWKGRTFPTSEHAYHWEKFSGSDAEYSIRYLIRHAASAHEAFKIAERCKRDRRPEWDEVKVDTMREILRAKVEQHEYVRMKLLATGDRELIEDSWRDDFWGWGPNRNGKNMLGKLWMEIRADLAAGRAAEQAASSEEASHG